MGFIAHTLYKDSVGNPTDPEITSFAGALEAGFTRPIHLADEVIQMSLDEQAHRTQLDDPMYDDDDRMAFEIRTKEAYDAVTARMTELAPEDLLTVKTMLDRIMPPTR